MRIAWRLALDRLRSAGRRERRELAAAELSRSPTVEDPTASGEFQQHLQRARGEGGCHLKRGEIDNVEPGNSKQTGMHFRVTDFLIPLQG